MATFKYIHEVLLETCKLENREDRIKYLQENAYKQVKSVLQLCYNDRIQLDLPKGKPPFTPCPEGREPAPIANAFKPIGLTVKGNSVTRMKKEKIFIQILETLHLEDAKLLCAAKDGTIAHHDNKKYSKITKSLVEASFPDLLK